MSWFTDLYRSAVGRKAVMAVTGIILFGFIVLHLIGNLKLYEPGLYRAPGGTGPGVRYINAYGVFLRHVGEPALPAEGALWILRIVLLVAVVLHVWAAWQLTLMSRAARPRAYGSRPEAHTPYPPPPLRLGGVINPLFLNFPLVGFPA